MKFAKLLILVMASLFTAAIATSVAAKSTKLGGDFELTTHLGESFHLSDISGKVGILFFGFTHCPDVCPTTLLELQRLLNDLGDQSDAVSVLFVSVDPKRDTPEKLDGYVKYFNKNIIGLTGTEAQLAKVLEQYNSSAKLIGDTDTDTYNVEHSANLYLINKQGELGSIILPRTPYVVIEQQVRKLIDQ